ncbi:MAG: hypothetical protein L3J75_14970 [Methylococcaceae bacterium]|nr:hypothetical protein [Methylococcaceae bacterium]
MKKITFSSLLTVILILLVGCGSVSTKVVESSTPENIKTLLASGYSQLRKRTQMTQGQNTFATEQSAKLNAYRELAKQVYTEKLDNGLVVADQVLKDEAYRIFLDLFLREAQVVESKTIADQKKIALALGLTPRFYQCFSGTVAVVSQCLQEDNKIPFTRIGYQHAALSRVNLSCAASGCIAPLSVSGFSKEKDAVDNVLLDYGLYDTEWTANIALKTLLRYFVLSKQIF